MTFDEIIEQLYCVAILDLRITKDEFLDLTPYEFSILILHKNKTEKNEYILLRNVIYNAGLNLLRKKGDKEIPLFEEDKSEDNLSDMDRAKKERELLFGNK